VDALIDHARQELSELVPGAEILVFRVPGAFEIPSCVSYILRHTHSDAVITLGVIIRGSTGHADLVAQGVTEQLARLAVDHACPVIHEVLLLENEEQAVERCHGQTINRGTEAARAAANMMDLFQQLHQAFPPAAATTQPAPHISFHGQG
jgi:6,7-dimethyl-8-ribityllumazine synthase